MKILARIIVAITLLLTALPAEAARSVWEACGQVAPRDIERIDDSGAEISVHDGMVYLTLTRPVNVKVLTILGQVVGQETLPAGVHRLKLTTRGIYILKVGQLTRRVTI